MATYATFAQLTQRYGTAALTAMIPVDSTDSLEILAGQAMVEAAGEIDMDLGSCGYSTPVDTSLIANADQQSRTTAILRRIEIGLAVSALSREFAPKSNVKRVSTSDESVTWSTQARADTAWARSTLKSLCDRQAILPGVSSSGRTFVKTDGVTAPALSDVDSRIANAGAW